MRSLYSQALYNQILKLKKGIERERFRLPEENKSNVECRMYLCILIRTTPTNNFCTKIRSNESTQVWSVERSQVCNVYKPMKMTSRPKHAGQYSMYSSCSHIGQDGCCDLQADNVNIQCKVKFKTSVHHWQLIRVGLNFIAFT